MNKNSNSYIILYASVMVVIVAAVLSFVSLSLGGIQAENVRIEKMGDILRSVGQGGDADHVADKSAYITEQYRKYIVDSYAVNAAGDQMMLVSLFDNLGKGSSGAAVQCMNLMLGLELRHVGVNSGTPEQSMKDAQMLSKLLGWPIDEHKNANFVGEGFDVMKVPFRGTHGHIAVACNSIKRARWHMERRGFAFDDSSVIMKDGKMRAIYLKDEIAGFAVHLLQK